jgi:hypothetical protein
MPIPDDFKAHAAQVVKRYFDNMILPEDWTTDQRNRIVIDTMGKAYAALHRHIRRKKVDHEQRAEMRTYAQHAAQLGADNVYLTEVKKPKRYK